MAEDSIACDAGIRHSVYTMLDPAYEDLFDLAEEHTLKSLLTPWIEMSSDDSDMFRKVLRQTHTECLLVLTPLYNYKIHITYIVEIVLLLTSG